MWSFVLGLVGKAAGLLGLSQLRVWFTIGAVVAATAFIATVYVKGQQSVRHANEVRNLREQNAALERLYSATRKEAVKMAQEAEEDDKRISELNEYIQGLETRNDLCFSVDDVDRLQDLIGR